MPARKAKATTKRAIEIPSREQRAKKAAANTPEVKAVFPSGRPEPGSVESQIQEQDVRARAKLSTKPHKTAHAFGTCVPQGVCQCQ